MRRDRIIALLFTDNASLAATEASLLRIQKNLMQAKMRHENIHVRRQRSRRSRKSFCNNGECISMTMAVKGVIEFSGMVEFSHLKLLYRTRMSIKYLNGYSLVCSIHDVIALHWSCRSGWSLLTSQSTTSAAERFEVRFAKCEALCDFFRSPLLEFYSLKFHINLANFI